jgi:hypothetical protein
MLGWLVSQKSIVFLNWFEGMQYQIAVLRWVSEVERMSALFRELQIRQAVVLTSCRTVKILPGK